MSGPPGPVPAVGDAARVLAVRAAVDADRAAAGPADGGVVREYDGRDWRVVWADGDPAALVAAESARAAACGATVEWKVYGHDPVDFAPALRAGGWAAAEAEQVLAFDLADPLPPTGAADVRAVTDAAGLADLAVVSREVGRRDVAAETARLAAVLAAAPETLRVHVAYVDGEPAAAGRAHYARGGGRADARAGGCVELAGGRTRPAYRRRGLFGALVAVRLAEGRARGRRYAVVDALPTSAPLLRRLGFRPVTGTRPYLWHPPTGG